MRFAAMIAFEMQASPPPHRTPHPALIAGNKCGRVGWVALSALLSRLAGLQELHLDSKPMLHDEPRLWLCCLHVLLMLCVAL